MLGKTIRTVAAIAVLVVAPITSAVSDDTITLTFSAFTNSNSANHRATIDRMIEEIQAASNGRVMFETYFGGFAYGDARRQVDQVRRGVVDISHSLFSYTPGRFPIASIAELPFIYDDSVAASVAFWEVYRDYLGQSMPDVHPIAVWMTTMQQLHLRQPVDGVENLQGLKIRAGGPIMVDALAALGAEGILTPASATYESLEKGVLDGAVGTWAMLSAFNVGEVTSRHIELDISAAPLFLLMNKRKYESLPDDVRALIDAYSSPAAIRDFAEAFRVSDRPGLEIAATPGHTIAQPDDAQRKYLRAQVASVVEAHFSQLESEGFEARAFFARFMAAYERERSARAQ